MSFFRGSRAHSPPVVKRAPVPEVPNLHQIILPTPWDVGNVQVYLVEGEPLTLIDTGVNTPESFAALEAAFDELGHGLDEVERIILTHYHEDHLGQAQVIRDLGAVVEVWAHEAEAHRIENWSPELHENLDATLELFAEYGVPAQHLDGLAEVVRGHLEQTPISGPTHVDRALHDGDRVPFKDFELTVIHSPGHTAGHLLLHEEASGTVVTGDHIMGSAVPYTENYYMPGAPDPRDSLLRRPRFSGLREYTRSVREMRRLAVSTILPAHGGVIRQAGRSIEDASLFYEVRVQRIERGLRSLAAMEQEVTAWEVWHALFPKADPVHDLRNRMLMVIGALDLLEEKGDCITSRRSDGVLVHSHSPSERPR